MVGQRLSFGVTVSSPVIVQQVSCDLQCWEDSLRAYHRMIDLQHKFVDAEILSVFVHGITEGFSDSATPPGWALVLVLYVYVMMWLCFS